MKTDKTPKVPFQTAAPKPCQDEPPKMEFISFWNPGIGRLLIMTAKAPRIISGIVTMNESRIAIRCLWLPTLAATGIKCFSIKFQPLCIKAK